MKTFTKQIEVRFSDCDGLGHTNNAVYLAFMEESRIQFCRDHFGATFGGPLKKEQFPFILARTECDFIQQTFMTQIIDVISWVSHVGTKSFTLDYDMQDHKTGQTVAKGKAVLVWFDFEKNETAVIPDVIRQKLNNG